MSDKRLGVIGFGAIGRQLAAAWLTRPVRGFELAAWLVRPHQVDEARAGLPPELLVTADMAVFMRARLDRVIEAAGQGAVRAHGEGVLAAGCDLMVLSVGALAEVGMIERFTAAARSTQRRVVLPVGAIAGLDGLMALRRAGLTAVTYRSTKPPRAWLGTPAEQRFALLELTTPTVIFEGTAREAASGFPKNANIAAAVALAGLGLDETRVELVADPSSSQNIGRIEAVGVSSSLTVIVAGTSSAANPKTSAITGMSVLSSLENESASIAFG